MRTVCWCSRRGKPSQAPSIWFVWKTATQHSSQQATASLLRITGSIWYRKRTTAAGARSAAQKRAGPHGLTPASHGFPQPPRARPSLLAPGSPGNTSQGHVPPATAETRCDQTDAIHVLLRWMLSIFHPGPSHPPSRFCVSPQLLRDLQSSLAIGAASPGCAPDLEVCGEAHGQQLLDAGV